MRLAVCIAFAFTGSCLLAAPPSDAVYAPLRLYQGSWQLTRKDQPNKIERLKNDCAKLGNFYACQQTVDGTPENLIVFVPANPPGHYHTQSVQQDARATGRGDLEISGDRWVYSSTWDEGGKTTYYRTTNVFTGKDHIHYEQAESPDGKDWKITNSGDEVRVSNSAR